MAGFAPKSAPYGSSESTLSRRLNTGPKLFRTWPESFGAWPEWLRTHPQSLGTGPQSLGTGPESLGTWPESFRTNPESLRIWPESLGTWPESFRPQPAPLRTHPQSLWTPPEWLRNWPDWIGTAPQSFQESDQSLISIDGKHSSLLLLFWTYTTRFRHRAGLNHGLRNPRIRSNTEDRIFNVLTLKEKTYGRLFTKDRQRIAGLVQQLSVQIHHGPTLGFTATDVTKVTNDYQMLAFVVEAAEAIRNQSLAYTSYKNTLRDGPIGTVMPGMPPAPSLSPPDLVTPGIVPRLRALVQRIKAQPQYNETIGNNLGIIAAAAPPSPTPSKPTATAAAEPGSAVRIDWVKAGFDGVLVEGQRASEALWTALGMDLQS